jgi:hypothetical protein
MTADLHRISFDNAVSALRLTATLNASESASGPVNWCSGAAEGLAEHGNSLLKSSSTWDEIKKAVAALSATACLRLAARALADAERMPRSADRIRSVLRELASENLTQALSRMAPLAARYQARQPRKAGTQAKPRGLQPCST